jgi:hypothetical protein
MMTGCARSAAHTPRQPTWASCASGSGGSGGTRSAQPSPTASSATDNHSACGLDGPTAASSKGPMTKVAPTMVSNRPTARPRR